MWPIKSDVVSNRIEFCYEIEKSPSHISGPPESPWHADFLLASAQIS